MINLTEAKAASESEIKLLKAIALYQFSPEISECLFPPNEKFFIQYSASTGKIRNILDSNYRLFLVLRAQDYLFSLTEISALIVKKCSQKPKFRFVVQNDISQFIRDGRNVFCKFVLDADNNIRAGDEVLVVNEDDELLAIGRARVSGEEVKQYKRGVAVIVKREIKDEY
ncbi:PUA domain-containing protein [Stygiolobus caldivivus]|uniref:PUA domain-containing protein n=1 Tax=Stygiolobus caldivivus TaxID=2824673 RepID=A0A8D5U890_9CREN|nr:PUA domain-containing protein [Stygiolobus caldivivus]BCU70596.1 hypothetical protein KN1_18930 [Stygiolobus caldivivus]